MSAETEQRHNEQKFWASVDEARQEVSKWPQWKQTAAAGAVRPPKPQPPTR